MDNQAQFEGPKLFTIALDYFATGEGRTLMCMLTKASSVEQALLQFEKRFGSYFGSFAVISEGIDRTLEQGLLLRLLSEDIIKTAEDLAADAGNFTVFGQLHFNLS